MKMGGMSYQHTDLAPTVKPSAPIIDLIYVMDDKGSTISCALFGGEHDVMLGPVPEKNAIKNLSEMVAAALPDQFGDFKSAEKHLVFVHVRNLARGHNESGQSYPSVLKR